MILTDWIGRSESCLDTVTAAPLVALSATLDRDDPPPQPGDPVPLLWHWLYCLPIHRQSELGADGHARLGGFLPPVPLPRRMYAGGRIEVHHPLRVGDAIERVSRIESVSEKEGRIGPLVFVKVRHEIRNRQGLALVEDHDIVYRQAEAASRPAPIGPARQDQTNQAAWTREIVPDEVLLFRYSALTFNGFRIHYDRRFATEVQHYQGLVVHAPLVATLLADLLRCYLPAASVSAFSFRAIRPLVDGEPFVACGLPDADGQTVHLCAQDAQGAAAFEATAMLAQDSIA